MARPRVSRVRSEPALIRRLLYLTLFSDCTTGAFSLVFHGRKTGTTKSTKLQPTAVDFGSPVQIQIEHSKNAATIPTTTGAAQVLEPTVLVEVLLSVASTPAQHERGLMHRAEPLAKREGMVFVYPTPAKRVFWMKDTLIPLQATWWDQNGVLREPGMEMQPEDLTYVWSLSSDIVYGIEFPPHFLADAGLNDPGNVRIVNLDAIKNVVQSRGGAANGLR
ncbi:unnamed protein product [Amoebophrya sp. A25]|nr:unnamed protein product [Amoebophrya sp. A25]|eukprot:GSA25T00015935001.1